MYILVCVWGWEPGLEGVAKSIKAEAASACSVSTNKLESSQS